MMNKKLSWKNERWVKPYLAQYKWNFILAIFSWRNHVLFAAVPLLFYAGYTIDKAATHPEKHSNDLCTNSFNASCRYWPSFV